MIFALTLAVLGFYVGGITATVLTMLAVDLDAGDAPQVESYVLVGAVWFLILPVVAYNFMKERP